MANLSNINNKFIVASDGKVGIGTTVLNAISGTNPTLTLGGTGISGGLILQKAGTDTARLYENAGNMVHQGMTGIGHHFYVNAATQAMVIDTSGNVGIGIPTPSKLLHLYGADATVQIQGLGTSSDAGVNFFPRDGSNVAHLQSIKGVGSSLTFLTGGNSGNSYVPTERMRIDSSGNLLLGNGVGNPYLSFLSAGGNGGNERARIFGYADGGTYGGGLEIQTRDSLNIFQNRINIDSSGNVGIGTTSPLSPLSIQANSGGSALRFIGRSDGISGIDFFNSAQTVANYFQSNGTWIRSRADGGFHFSKGSTPITTDVDGFTIEGMNVGIGTTSPSQKLDVVGIIKSSGVSNSLMFSDRNTASNTWEWYSSGNNAGLYKNHNVAGTVMTIDSSGNVGIGTDSPDAKVDILGLDLNIGADNGAPTTRTNSTVKVGVITSPHYTTAEENFTGMLLVGNSNVNEVAIGGGTSTYNSASLLTFFTSADSTTVLGTERMRITSGGYVQAGNVTNDTFHEFAQKTTNAQWTMVVRNTTALPYGLLLKYDTSPNNADQHPLYFSDATTARFYMTSNGAVYNNGTYGTISDRKLKENIIDATPKLDDINKLKVRNFNFKDNTEEKHIGFIAQEFEEVFPKAIENTQDRDEDNNLIEDSYTKTIKTSILIPMLVKSIQELKADNDSLKARIETLENN
jgi:hypothetical protein